MNVGGGGFATVTAIGWGLLVSWVVVSVAVTSIMNPPLTLVGGLSVMTPVVALIVAHDGGLLVRPYWSGSPEGPVAVAVTVTDWPPVTVWFEIELNVGGGGFATVTAIGWGLLVSWVVVSVAVTSIMNPPLTLVGVEA